MPNYERWRRYAQSRFRASPERAGPSSRVLVKLEPTSTSSRAYHDKKHSSSAHGWFEKDESRPNIVDLTIDDPRARETSKAKQAAPLGPPSRSSFPPGRAPDNAGRRSSQARSLAPPSTSTIPPWNGPDLAAKQARPTQSLRQLSDTDRNPLVPVEALPMPIGRASNPASTPPRPEFVYRPWTPQNPGEGERPPQYFPHPSRSNLISWPPNSLAKSEAKPASSLQPQSNYSSQAPLPRTSTGSNFKAGPEPRPAVIIPVPQDPQLHPSIVSKRVEALRRDPRANRPFLSMPVYLSEEEFQHDIKDNDIETPTPGPGEREAKKKKKDKARENEKKYRAKENDNEKKQREEEDAPVQSESTEKATSRTAGGEATKGTKSKKRPVEETGEVTQNKKKKRQVEETEAKAVRPDEAQPAVAKISQKRQREVDNADAEAEARAIQRRRKKQVKARATETLRGVIPSVYMARVRNRLANEEGTALTELSVLLTAAKEMVVDLAKSQVMQTAQLPNESHAEMLSILRAQEARLQKLEEGNTAKKASGLARSVF